MESVKINLTIDKVRRIIDQYMEKDRGYISTFNGKHTEETKRVDAVIQALNSKLNFKNEVRIANAWLCAGYEGLNKSTSCFFIEKGINTIFTIIEDDYKIQFCFNPKYNCIELYIIQTRLQGTGLGTELMKTILDVMDELGEKLYLTPCPFIDDANYNTEMKRHNRFLKLRDFYLSFEGFQRIALNTPSLIYTPE